MGGDGRRTATKNETGRSRRDISPCGTCFFKFIERKIIMKAKINPEYDMLDRVWRVDTEGDEEGGSMRFLGVYKGRLDDIAFALADKAAYLLQFTAVDLNVPAPKTLRNSVNVRLNVESKTWHLTPVERVNIMSRLMDITSTTVTDSNFADAVRLQRNITEDDIKRYNALAKLTPEERELLGLSM